MPKPTGTARIKNLSVTAIAGLAGCLITIIVLVALFAGLWLDAQFKVRGLFTIVLLVLSAPVALLVVVRIVLKLVSVIQTPPQEPQDTDTTSMF